ncbi:JNK1/MAPK8-associated membrane protein-like isoform X2 [Patiria miniata]|uniref:JNK1/MAPK8-associated membrane protein n=1 Tax=Patiria miniata TaxID=46514 RepID=A0A914BCE4_PATMI|nr:JNK1/MAPK8-associated membrane protein-like isoform X2 [Patiria miniata]
MVILVAISCLMLYYRTRSSFFLMSGVVLLTLMLVSEAEGATFNPFEPYQGSLVQGQKTCPGPYCGRVQLLNTSTNDSYGPCGACPRGQRGNAMSICEPCTSEPLFYDWLYIGFMVNLSLGLHLFFIDFFSKGYRAFLLHGAAVVECILATLMTLLLIEPKGSLTIHACGVQTLSDWYTMLNNPTPDYTRTLHCTQEAVYPLYTVVFVIYTFELLLMMLFRPLLSVKLCKNQGRNSIYAALYFLPLLVLLHALCAGLIYYSFPYILIISSLLMHAVHFAYSEIETPKKLVSNLRNLVILLAHWLCHAYGIISLTGLADPPSNLPLLALVVVPMVFYLSTEQFTEPHRIQSNEI